MSSLGQPAVIFLALEPEESMASVVWSYKDRVRSLVGPQNCLHHPPHLTLYLAMFASPSRVVEAAAQVVERIASPRLEIDGWHVFENHMANQRTLVCHLADDLPRLHSIQRQLAGAVAPLHDSMASMARYDRHTPPLNSMQQASLREFGFPYVGDIWHPHLTIASIAGQDWPAIERELLPKRPRCTAAGSKLTIYWLVKGELCVLESFSLPREEANRAGAQTRRSF